MKVELMKDPLYEDSIKALLEKSQAKLQTLLDGWNDTGLNPLSTASELYELVWHTDILYNEAVMRLKSPPPGLSDEQQADYMNRLKIPSVYPIEQLADLCKIDGYCLREMNAFTLKGKKVIPGPGHNALIKQKSVIVDKDSEEEKLGKDVLEMAKAFNSLNKKARGLLPGLITGGELVVQCGDLKAILEIE